MAVGGDGVLEFAPGGEDHAEIGVVRGDGRTEGHGLADEFFGGLAVPRLVGEDPEHMKSVGMPGVL